MLLQVLVAVPRQDGEARLVQTHAVALLEAADPDAGAARGRGVPPLHLVVLGETVDPRVEDAVLPEARRLRLAHLEAPLLFLRVDLGYELLEALPPDGLHPLQEP